jgi:Terminase RNaseH-like domain
MPALDLWPLLETLTIRTKTGKLHRLNRNDKFAWAQREVVREIEWQYNHGLPVRIIVLKGRQLGCSTLIEAILFIWSFLYPGSNSLVLSKDQESSDYLFGMFKLYWERGPFHGLFETKYDRANYMEWHGTRSSVKTDTAKQENVGRSMTVQAAHCSEVAFWDKADEITGSLGEAIPYEHGTIVVYESTAQGVGNFFHDEWEKSRNRLSTFTPMFFAWFLHDEYCVRDHNLTFAELEDDERELLKTYPEMTLGNLAWRRRKLQSYTNPEKFKEEYPCCPEEAFLATGTNVFPLEKLKQCFDPDVDVEQGYLVNDNGKLTWVDDPRGHTWVYKRPDQRYRRRYVVAVDSTWTVEGDPGCIQVLDRASMEQVAVWHGRADPETLGNISLALALWYGPETILNAEIQGGGKRVMQVWRDANWTNLWYDYRPDHPRLRKSVLGWNTTFESKTTMLGTMQGVILRKHLILHHPATYYEMTHYIANEDGTWGPARRKGHDDTVMALGVAIMTVVTEAGNMDYSGMAAPEPAHIPGLTPPRFPNQGKALAEVPGLGRFAPTGTDDPSVWEVY